MSDQSYFGPFLKSLRLASRTSLRDFSLKVGQDCAYISRMERRLISAPQSIEVLNKYAEVLNLGPVITQDLVDLAYTDNGLIPPDVWEKRPASEYLPAFWRGYRNLPESEINAFIEKCKNA
jgi:transcriptional regulator with XRE-family HTH domain